MQELNKVYNKDRLINLKIEQNPLQDDPNYVLSVISLFPNLETLDSINTIKS